MEPNNSAMPPMMPNQPIPQQSIPNQPMDSPMPEQTVEQNNTNGGENGQQ